MITLEIKDTEVTQTLTRLGALLDDLSLVMADIGQQLVFSTKERMVAGKAVDGTPFAPRKASTLAAYEKRGLKPGPQPLWLTGTMRQNIHHSYGPDSVRVASGAALLHKLGDGRASPFPGQTYPATSVTGVPSAVKPFRTATRSWNSAT